MYHVTSDIRQAEVTTLIAMGQLLVVDAELMQNSGMNVMHMGDTYFAGMYPYIDVDGGGSIQGMIAAAERGVALANDDTRVIPGHGPLSNRSELAAYRDMLIAVRLAVQQHVGAGHTVDQTVAARPTRDLDLQWTTGFMKPEHIVRITYRSLSTPD